VAPSDIFCTACGAANQAQDSFCFACGRPLKASTSTPNYSVSKSGISTLTGLLIPHHLLKHRYSIISEVGKGGMGAVYKAEDTLFHNRLVAVKEMSQSGLSQQEVAEAVDGFKREAHMLADLEHQSLPKIQDYFNDAGRWYLVMDFIEGETLRRDFRELFEQ
jgi:eukaryotic-like serine/threonine-protein kinase